MPVSQVNLAIRPQANAPHKGFDTSSGLCQEISGISKVKHPAKCQIKPSLVSQRPPNAYQYPLGLDLHARVNTQLSK